MRVNRKRVYGVVARYRAPGSTGEGYRPVWEVGRAAGAKRKTRRRGINRPST